MVHPLSSLRGSSAEALQVLGKRVEEAGAVHEQFAELGRDLFELAGLLRSEAALRRALTDVSTPAEAKASLVHQLLDGRAGSAAVEVLAQGAGLRWLAVRDLADALEHLGVIATVRAAGREDAGRLADELFAVGELVDANPELRIALSDPVRSTADKRGLLRGLLEGKVLPATITLVEQSLSGSHRSVGVAIAEYQKVAAAVYGEGVARVRIARPLADAERGRLQEALSRHYGRPVHLNVVVDPEVLGGIRVEIGDDVIDGTVLARLDSARRKLAG